LTTDAYVFVASPTVGGELDFTRLRGYVLADAHARFRRARGDDVLFTLGSDAASPDRAHLDALALSFDWDRAIGVDAPEIQRWSRWLFEELVKAGRAYRRGQGWYLHGAELNEENDRRLDELDGWDSAVRKAQRKLLHRVDGYDFDATALDGTTLSVFTGHPDSVSDAAFVGLSPLRPELDGWLDDGDARRRVEELRTGDWSQTPLEQMPVVEVGMSIQVPSVPQPLPILVSPAIDARFGPAAILGIPSADSVDQALAKRLPKAGGLAWKVESKPPKTTPAVRYLIEDMPLARANGEDVEAAEIDPRLSAAWMEVALAVAPAERAENMFEHADAAGRLPTTRAVLEASENGLLLDMRTIAKALRDLGPLGDLADGEPLGPTALHAPFTLEGMTVEGALTAHGADPVRFALLYAAAPGKRFSGGEQTLTQATGVLDRLRALAESRLADATRDARIDDGDGLRRRLASWCDTAIERVTENLERLDLHRATRNVVELLSRIEDYEARVVRHRGEVTGADREAATVAVSTLVRLLAPITPTLAEELWKGAGQDGSVGDSGWPAPRREAAAA
jgi:leucyl-tRNA synthetase